MSRTLNKTILMGNLATEPEIRYTGDAVAVATFRLVTDNPVKRDDNWTTEPEYHNIVAYGRIAEVIKEYVHKGNRLYIEGRNKTRNWDDKDTGKKVYKTEVVINDDGLFLLDRPEKDSATSAANQGAAA